MASAFEFVMVEWGKDPIYIREKWTEELLILMMDKLVERKQIEAEVMSGKKQDRVGFRELFGKLGGEIPKIGK